jgi:hypothetical protein
MRTSLLDQQGALKGVLPSSSLAKFCEPMVAVVVMSLMGVASEKCFRRTGLERRLSPRR